MMNFSKNLRELRAKKNITQEALAENIGVTRQMINRYESGENYPEMDKAILLAQTLDCKLDDLINMRDAAQNGNPFQNQIVSVKIEKPKLSKRDKIILNVAWDLIILFISTALVAFTYNIFGREVGNPIASISFAGIFGWWLIVFVIFYRR